MSDNNIGEMLKMASDNRAKKIAEKLIEITVWDDKKIAEVTGLSEEVIYGMQRKAYFKYILETDDSELSNGDLMRKQFYF